MESRDNIQQGFFHQRVFLYMCKQEIIALLKAYTQVQDTQGKNQIADMLGQKLQYAVAECELLKLELDLFEGQSATRTHIFIEKRLVFRELANFLTSLKHIAAELGITVPSFSEEIPQVQPLASNTEAEYTPLNADQDQILFTQTRPPAIPNEITPRPTVWGDKTVGDLILLMERTDSVASMARALGMQANTLEGILCKFPLKYRKLKSAINEAGETHNTLIPNVSSNVLLKDLIQYWETKTVGDLFREVKKQKLCVVLDYLKINNAKTLKILIGKITGSN